MSLCYAHRIPAAFMLIECLLANVLFLFVFCSVGTLSAQLSQDFYDLRKHVDEQQCRINHYIAQRAHGTMLTRAALC